MYVPVKGFFLSDYCAMLLLHFTSVWMVDLEETNRKGPKEEHKQHHEHCDFLQCTAQRYLKKTTVTVLNILTQHHITDTQILLRYHPSSMLMAMFKIGCIFPCRLEVGVIVCVCVRVCFKKAGVVWHDWLQVYTQVFCGCLNVLSRATSM